MRRLKFEYKKTDRGFPYIETKDMYNAGFSIQESSLATDYAIWLGIDDPDPKIMASDAKKHGIKTDQEYGWIDYHVPEDVLISTRMHLTRSQVADLIPVLQHYVDTGELPKTGLDNLE